MPLFTILKDFLLNPSEVQHSNLNFSATQEKRLCSVLGLHDDLAHKLASLKPMVRGHQTDEYFLLRFLEGRAQYSEDSGNLRDREAVASKLEEMGFRKSRSAVIAKWIAEQPFAEHQSLLAWARCYIENLFKYDIVINDHVARYPYKRETLNEWFEISVKRNVVEDSVCGSEDGHSKYGVVIHQVKAVNVHTNDSKVIEEKIKQLQSAQQPGKQFYFHGTDHESAKSILGGSINLGTSKPCCDFSSGYGFYLTNSSSYAIEWSKKSEACAVLVFYIKEGDLHRFHSLDLSSHEKKSDWDMVKNHHRFESNLPDHLYDECKSCDYIRGPMSLDSTHQLPQVDQICVKSQAMAGCIGNPASICGVVFANTKDWH